MTFEKLKTVTREVIARAIDPDNEPPIQRVYYRDAPDTENAYPYIVYDFERDNTGDFYRDDVRIFVDIWDRSPNYKSVEQLGDRIDRALNDLNYPSGDILPTTRSSYRQRMLPSIFFIRSSTVAFSCIALLAILSDSDLPFCIAIS